MVLLQRQLLSSAYELLKPGGVIAYVTCSPHLAETKGQALIEFAKSEQVELSQTVAIGDGANDLDMIEAAGLGIAFNAKPKVAAAAATTINTADLSAVLLLMGIPG